MLLEWKAQGIMTLAGYILGFPADTPASIRHDIEILKRELPIDIVEFFCLTPLPGSEDHQTLWKSNVPMDADLNNYDIEHVCTSHSKMSQKEWQDIYLEAWSLYYTPAHMETLLRRCATRGGPIFSLLKLLLNFSLSVRLEQVHPLQSGILRLRHPSERRPGLPRESPITFWPYFVFESIYKTSTILSTAARLALVGIKVARDPKRFEYLDQALIPVSDEDDETLELLTQSAAAKQAAAHQKRVRQIASGAA
jgi:hypothetical protein